MACGLHRLALRSLVFCGVVYYNKSIRIKLGKLHIVLSNGIYVDTLNLMPRIQNQIRSMAAFDNPVFYKNKRLGYSSYYHFGAIYMGKDEDGYIAIPRGHRIWQNGSVQLSHIRKKSRPFIKPKQSVRKKRQRDWYFICLCINVSSRM